MKTAVRRTSIDAYRGLGKHLNEQQKQVLRALRELGESCIADIAEYLGWQRSTVAGRMNELKRKGLLEFAGKYKSRTTGITCEFWKARPYQETLF